MGTQTSHVCRSCGTRFSVQDGGGFFFDELHCDACGGRYRYDAPPRCPGCRSTSEMWAEDEAGESVIYDLPIRAEEVVPTGMPPRATTWTGHAVAAVPPTDPDQRPSRMMPKGALFPPGTPR